MDAALVICRTPAALPRLRRLRLSRPLIVASDDRRVHQAALSDRRVIEVRDLERPESFYAVAAEVRARLEIINDRLADIARQTGWPRRTLSWGYNVEGGLLNQRLQDALLLIRSYQALFRSTRALEAHLLLEPRWQWDDQVLALAAAAEGVSCRTHEVHPLPRRMSALWRLLRPWAIAAYYHANILRRGGFRRRPPPSHTESRILFQVCSAWPKHIENVAPLMAALGKRGMGCAALCWTASERQGRADAADRIRQLSLAAVRLERWVAFSDAAASAAAAWRVSRALKAAVASKPWTGLDFSGVPLAPLLAESFRHFLVAELPQRIRYQRAFESCAVHFRPVAVKLSGGPESFEGSVALRCWDSFRPLVFHYWLGASLEWPYADGAGSVDLFLAKGPAEAGHAAVDYRLASDQIEIVGQSRFAGYTEYASRVPPEESRRKLALPPGSLYVGLDPNCAIRGYQSAREQAEMTAAVLRAAAGRPGLVVVVKPHPSYAIGHLQPLFDAAGKNIVVLDRHAPLMDFLNAVDVVVTKYSTLIVEAALMNRPSVAVLLDGELRFKVFGDIPQVMRSSEELQALVEKLAQDRDAFSAWRQEELTRHRRLLSEFYYRDTIGPSALAADAICRRLGPSGPSAPIDP